MPASSPLALVLSNNTASMNKKPFSVIKKESSFQPVGEEETTPFLSAAKGQRPLIRKSGLDHLALSLAGLGVGGPFSMIRLLERSSWFCHKILSYKRLSL